MPPESGFLLRVPRFLLLLELFTRDRQRLLPLPSNCHNEEQREVYRVEQPPERGIVDVARELVSTRSRQISVVDGVLHQTAQLPTANAASSSTARCLKVAGVVCDMLEATGICCALLVPTRIIFSAVEVIEALRRLSPELGNIMCRETLKKESGIEKIVQKKKALDSMLPDSSETAFLESVSQIMDHISKNCTHGLKMTFGFMEKRLELNIAISNMAFTAPRGFHWE
nr:phosphatidylinositol 4-kinase gamma 4-like [Ipomoea batatas]